MPPPLSYEARLKNIEGRGTLLPLISSTNLLMKQFLLPAIEIAFKGKSACLRPRPFVSS